MFPDLTTTLKEVSGKFTSSWVGQIATIGNLHMDGAQATHTTREEAARTGRKLKEAKGRQP